MKAAGSIIIGMLTAALGYPILSKEGFNFNGFIVCTLSCLLWLIIYDLLKKD